MAPDPALIAARAPGGLAVITADGVFAKVNEAGARLFGSDPERLAGTASPFEVPADAERVVSWEPVPGARRELAYLCSPVRERAGLWVVSFRDVTDSRRNQGRLSAIAAAAASVAASRSLSGTLGVLAEEIVRTDGIAAAQILTVNAAGDSFRVMGAAGFARTPDFFDKLLACSGRGAELMTLRAFSERRPVVVPHRYETIMSDPAWIPLREIMRTPRWDGFVSVPLSARGAPPAGVLNVFFGEGQVTGSTETEFLLAMAEQAALAVGQANLLDREREMARREERQRLARDLHDSVVQQVFSISMQAKSLSVLARRPEPPAPEVVRRVADDLSDVARTVLADLRGMVVDLRPAEPVRLGLEPALRSLAGVTTARTGIDVLLDVRGEAGWLDLLGADLAEDVYRILAEAVHNSVKHAAATTISISVRLETGAGRRLTAEVADDGHGLAARDGGTGGGARGGTGGGARGEPAADGYGMTAMWERAARWSGELTVSEGPGGGTRVSLIVPLSAVIPVEDPHWTVVR